MSQIREIRSTSELPAAIAPLRAAARAEGYGFLDRLAEQWSDRTNRFDLPGELLLGTWIDAQLAGIGGINRDPYAPAPRVGRIRHLYVRKDHRRRGVASELVGRLVAHAREHFGELRLRTDRAGAFYEAIGFAPVTSDTATHSLVFQA